MSKEKNTQQPAQAAPGDRNVLWCKKASELLPHWQWNLVNDAVKKALRATPPGDDAAGVDRLWQWSKK